MKNSLLFRPRRLSLLGGVLPLVAVSSLMAADDLLIDDFTDPAAAASTVRWWGNTPQTYEHDATEDAGGNAASGSLKVTVNYDIAAYSGENQFAARREIPGTPIDGSLYSKLEFDLKYAASSVAQGTSGNYGNLEVGIGHSDWSQFYFGTVQTAVGQNGWSHVSLTVNTNDAKLNLLRDFHFKQWSGGGDGMTGTQIFWIDNVKLIGIPSTEPPPPPPTATLEPAKPGLNLISSGTQTYSRQGIRTAAPEFSWVGAAGPVSYSFTVAEAPTVPGYSVVLYLVPGSGLTGVTDPDWTQPTCLLVAIGSNQDGSAAMRVAYKNELANSNGLAGHDYYTNETAGDLYDAGGPGAVGTGKGGTLGFVNSSTIKGQWKITFTSNTNLTVTPPAGNPMELALPNEATAQLFSAPLYVYFSTVPGVAANFGLGAVLSGISITGVANPIVEDFSVLPLNPVFEKAAADVAGVVQVSLPDTPYWLNWTLPAVGFVPQQSPELGNDAAYLWENLPAAEVITAQGRRRQLLRSTEFTGTIRNFFRLAKP